MSGIGIWPLIAPIALGCMKENAYDDSDSCQATMKKPTKPKRKLHPSTVPNTLQIVRASPVDSVSVLTDKPVEVSLYPIWSEDSDDDDDEDLDDASVFSRHAPTTTPTSSHAVVPHALNLEASTDIVSLISPMTTLETISIHSMSNDNEEKREDAASPSTQTTVDTSKSVVAPCAVRLARFPGNSTTPLPDTTEEKRTGGEDESIFSWSAEASAFGAYLHGSYEAMVDQTPATFAATDDVAMKIVSE